MAGWQPNKNISFPAVEDAGFKIGNDFGFDDLVGFVLPKTSGVGSPDLKIIKGDIRGFAYGAGDDGDGDFHLHHDFAKNTDLFLHVHWLHTGTAISGSLVVNNHLTYAKGHNQAAYMDEIIVPVIVSTPNIATVPQYQHRIDEIQISASGGLIASSVNVSITATDATLTSASALFVAGDVGRTVTILGAGVAGAALETTIASFTSTTEVELTDIASTTITAQPNFNYRVLNSDDFEPDGVIIIHYDTTTIPTISGAAVGSANEPFITFVDIHYNSTAFVTKNKAPNFYS